LRVHPSILPPELSFALEHRSNTGDRKRGAVLSLVGPEYAMENVLALQGARDVTLQVHSGSAAFLFNTPINKVVRLDRDELIAG